MNNSNITVHAIYLGPNRHGWYRERKDIWAVRSWPNGPSTCALQLDTYQNGNAHYF